MSLFLLDGKDMISKDAAYEVIAQEMNFPEYFGRNLDALYDCLTDLGSAPEIVFVNTAILLENLGEYGEKILSCFRDAASEFEFTFREKR